MGDRITGIDESGIANGHEAPKVGVFAPALLAAGAWTLLLGLSLGINLNEHREDARTHARFVANAYLDKDIAVRRWISGHGGVYVPPTDNTPPNPWLKVPERDVVTTGGKALTLVNPAYATRQLMEDFSAAYGIQGHLTALQLKNPGNAPDEWERAALRKLDGGEKEISEVVDRQGVPVLRQMRPVYMEKGCLRCHSDMGIPLGGLRGGIGAAVPLEPYLELGRAAVRKAIGTHGIIWLVGLTGIGISWRRSRDRRLERARTEDVARRDERRMIEVLSLSERLEKLDEREVIQEGLELAVRLTDSRIGYFHFVNDDQNTIELVTWSKATLEHYCKAAYDTHYPLDQAGVWADCARLREPVVHNDYPNLVTRRGLPEGHAPLQRHMSVPVVEAGQVRIIMGVGNKENPYDHDNVRLLQMLANDLWKLIQRRRSDLDLRASERLLREAQTLARMGSWNFDHQSDESTWSGEMYAIFEVDPASFKPTRESIIALLHPDDRAPAEAAFRKALDEHREYDATHRVPLAAGRVKLVRFRGVTQYAPDGTPQLSRGTAQDVTEKKEVELLRRSEANLSALIENTDRMIWSIDPERRLVVGNSLFLDGVGRLIGRKPEPGEIMPPADFLPAMAHEWHEYYRRSLEGEKFSVETLVPGAGEVPRWIEFSFFPIADDDGQILGVTVFGLDLTERRQMEESQLKTLTQMSRVMRELEAHHGKTLQTNRLNDLLQSSRNEKEALDVIRLSLAEIFAGQSGCLALVLGRDRELERVACWGSCDHVPLAFQVDDCWALRRGEVHEARRPEDLVCAHFDIPPEHGYLCLPLTVRGDTLGLLHLEYPEGANDEDLTEFKDIARSVGETIKLSLSNLRLRVALQEQATHDSLTGLFNRRYLDDTLPRELHRIQRRKGLLAVAMLDIDHFKRFNDTMGHEAGDLVLREIGRILRENLRKSDIGCRYGGEELVVIMPDSGIEDARTRMVGVCDLIRNMKVRYRGDALPEVTVSVGIAGTNRHFTDEVALLRAADDAMYAAKEAGRDRIVVADSPPAPE